MTWNYRIVRTQTPDGPQYGVFEVYYDDDGRPSMRTVDPITFTGDTEEEVREDLARAARPLTVLDDSEIGA